MASNTEPLAPELLALLRCPATGQKLTLARAELLAAHGLAAGLLRADERVLYPMENGIPLLLFEAAISLESADPSSA